MRIAQPADLDALAWGDGGLLPVVVQEVASGAVLMLAWADREAAARTLARGEGWFWSRSRQSLWRKGEGSGNTLAVVEVAADCDADALLYRVDAAGPACHTGARSCFEVGAAADDAPVAVAMAPRLELGWLWEVLRDRAGADPADSYTARLFAAGIDRVARKVGEEATEVVIAALRGPAPAGDPSSSAPLAAEAADLLYHLLVLLLAAGVPPEEVAGELRRRHARPATPPSAKPEDLA
ncbi:MAG TPA: bifunctional phosphoribosyl-AMP cyclohydrolase/phosphoribosyl-ATP diphosphatase HisIE [Thermoanaerobaculia bacterium]|nr:bifunctional phosphoribosyl-AMP cyclohydrolase/phosphoribosyl-ATP diphosphatase HisIE [Thermoanaerobaculia bacterium]